MLASGVLSKCRATVQNTAERTVRGKEKYAADGQREEAEGEYSVKSCPRYTVA